MIRRPPKQRPMTNFLLKAIRASGKSLYFLWNEARLNEYRFKRFVKGKGSLTLTSADRLVRALNLELSASVKAPHRKEADTRQRRRDFRAARSP